MPTFPATPLPQNTGLPAIEDTVLESRFDQGSIATRAKYTRSRKRFPLTYIGTLDEYYVFTDFFEDVRGRATTFDWTFPHPSTVVAASADTPIVITTRTSHGLRTGDQVVVADVNGQANGQRVVTRTGTSTVTLDGTTGIATASSGTITRYFPQMRFVLSAAGWPSPEKLDGPPRDNHAILRWVITLEEGF